MHLHKENLHHCFSGDRIQFETTLIQNVPRIVIFEAITRILGYRSILYSL